MSGGNCSFKNNTLSQPNFESNNCDVSIGYDLKIDTLSLNGMIQARFRRLMITLKSW